MTAPWVKRLAEVTTVSPLGLCEKFPHIGDLASGSNLSYQAAMKDRFLIRVPYAGESSLWTVLFNAQHDYHPPDFIFNESTDFLPRLDHLPSLLNWDVADNHSLQRVVSELYTEYKHYQRSVLKDTPSLHDSYTLLIQSGVVKEENIEVNHFYSKGQKTLSSIVFIMKLDLPFERIPGHLVKVSGPNLAILKIAYNLQTYKPQPSVGLKLSPRLSQAFGSSLQIPDFPAEGHLVEYVADLLEYLQERIESLDSGMSKRMSYIEHLQYVFKGAMLEYDDKEYSSANLLMNYLDFHLIVHISIPPYFPAEQPRLSLSSIYHSDENDLPFNKTIRSYPWSPRWSANEMAYRLSDYLLQVIPSFQRNSVNHGISLHADHSQENTTTQQTADNQVTSS